VGLVANHFAGGRSSVVGKEAAILGFHRHLDLYAIRLHGRSVGWSGEGGGRTDAGDDFFGLAVLLVSFR